MILYNRIILFIIVKHVKLYELEKIYETLFVFDILLYIVIYYVFLSL